MSNHSNVHSVLCQRSTIGSLCNVLLRTSWEHLLFFKHWVKCLGVSTEWKSFGKFLKAATWPCLVLGGTANCICSMFDMFILNVSPSFCLKACLTCFLCVYIFFYYAPHSTRWLIHMNSSLYAPLTGGKVTCEILLKNIYKYSCFLCKSLYTNVYEWAIS